MIDALFADRDREVDEVLEEVAWLGARLVLQAALEAEVGEFLGRDRYARGERACQGHRNGHQPTSVKTTAGEVELARPKVRGTLERFASRLLGRGVTKTNALESLVISGWVRGMSDRDIEAALSGAWAMRRACRSRPCLASVSRSSTSSRPGASATC